MAVRGIINRVMKVGGIIAFVHIFYVFDPGCRDGRWGSRRFYKVAPPTELEGYLICHVFACH